MKDIPMSETGAAPCERCPLEAGRAVAARGPVPATPSTCASGPRDAVVVAEATPAAPVDRPPEPTEPTDSEGDAVASGRGASAPEPEDAGTPDPAGVDSP